MLHKESKVMQKFNLKETSFMKWPLMVMLGIGLFSWPHIFGESPRSNSYPPLVASLRIDTPLEFCNERVPLEIQEVRERLEKELLLTLWDRPQVILWLKRSRRYHPYIEEMLQKSGLPDDLKFVPIAESALRPHAGSRKGAIGFWQFMRHTGRQHGLVINRRIDERRNIFASTQAAIRYFQNLHKQFGSWSLAAAAYNMGEEALAEEIQEQGIDDYYLLYLPLETQRYVFRILAIKLIFSDPKKYGFLLSDKDYYPPLEFDRIQITCRHDTHLRIIAKAAKTHFKAIKDLNPEIRGYSLPAGKHTILIPQGSAQDFEARYQYLLKHRLVNQKERIYVVKARDTLSSIADRFGVPLSAIITWNQLNPTGPIHPGDKLIIYLEELEPAEFGTAESTEILP
jgi:membrane-bound lytic murein transglycosylase D